ncbi:MAG: PAS domain S-box protein [Deltaproteobacteria bacterium]|nr:PAS domain S-box protein [Deltaproteobacteria bacterium]
MRRLAGLSDWVETVTDRPELPAPAAAAARDEIGTLARAVLTLVRRSAESLQASEESRDALSRSEERYRELLAACPDSVIVYDARGNVTYVNEAFEATYGWKPEEVIGRRLDFFVPEDELAASRQSWERALLGERVFCESARLTKDGRRLVVQITAAVVRDRDGAHRASLAIHRDLTLQRAAEAERREVERKVETSHKLESLGVLAGGIAHDFNNELTPIMGFTEQALDELEPESGVREKLERVLTAAGRARDLVSQILIFSRASEDVLSPVRVQPLVNEALYFLRASLPSTVEIVSDLRCERDLVNTNPSYIHQILMNLGTNAVHAMEKGGGTMRVGLETLERPQGGGSNDGEGWLRMTVSDTGCGIDPAMVDRIFEPFFTTKGVGEGTGMGLSVVHGIVKKLGGMISVRSNKGQGTTFEIHLPLVGASAEAGRAAPRGEMVGGTESILLVDDERDIAECWGQALEQLGYRTRAVRSGPDALALLDAHPGGFDLLVTYQTMPQMTGVALARRVLARSPGFPIVLCTGYSNAVDAETAAAEGIREFLMKPVSVPDLAAALRRALDGRDC